MANRSRLYRLGLYVAAVLQLMLPAFAAVADARAEAEARGAYAHIEAHEGARCPRVHPADCVVCRVLAGSAAPGTTGSLHIAIARVIDAEPAQARISVSAARLAGDPPQRAPPV